MGPLHDDPALSNIAGSSDVRKREPACLVVLDSHCGIVSAEPRFARFMADAGLTWEDQRRLPDALEQPLKTRGDAPTEAADSVLFVAPNLMMRAVELSGPGGSCIALSIERIRQRDPIAGAGRRYQLTRREIDVLRRILEGKSAQTIACELGVARSTVHEHFKHLVAKVGARNRSELVARILSWNPTNP